VPVTLFELKFSRKSKKAPGKYAAGIVAKAMEPGTALVDNSMHGSCVVRGHIEQVDVMIPRHSDSATIHSCYSFR
jgi:hypothetical protein